MSKLKVIFLFALLLFAGFDFALICCRLGKGRVGKSKFF